MLSFRRALILALVIFKPPSVTAQVEGRFYPEKTQYLVGEPVYIDFEVVNKGTGTLAVGIPSGHLDCGYGATTRYQVIGAQPAGFKGNPCCHRPTLDVCDDFLVELPPGRKHTYRFLLNFWFQLERAGIHPVRLTNGIKVKPREPAVSIEQENFYPAWQREVAMTSRFRISLVEGDAVALKSSFQPVVRDLQSKDAARKGWAEWAMVHLAPADFEAIIQHIAETESESGDTWWPEDAADGLVRLNTASARRALLRLVEHKDWDAIEALGKSGDRGYLPVLIPLWSEPEVRMATARAIGTLGGDEAVRFLVSELESFDAAVRSDAAMGLGYTGTHEAVGVLVRALEDRAVRDVALEALGRLTHRADQYYPCGVGLTPPPPPPNDQWPRWTAWWKANANRVPVYRWDYCGPTLPLD